MYKTKLDFLFLTYIYMNYLLNLTYIFFQRVLDFIKGSISNRLSYFSSFRPHFAFHPFLIPFSLILPTLIPNIVLTHYQHLHVPFLIHFICIPVLFVIRDLQVRSTESSSNIIQKSLMKTSSTTTEEDQYSVVCLHITLIQDWILTWWVKAGENMYSIMPTIHKGKEGRK